VEVNSQTLVESGADGGITSGKVCEDLCSEGYRYFYDNSCTLSFDPGALESAEAAEDLRQRGQSLEEGYGGAQGEGGAGSEAGSSSVAGSSNGGAFASTGGAGSGGKVTGGSTGTGGLTTSAGSGGGMRPPDSWSVLVSCSGYAESPCEGRRHASWGPCESRRATNALGAWFARAASNEAGSVRSFRALATELRQTPIGRNFSPRLRKAAKDEIRHARLMEREAHRYGSRRPKQTFSALSERRTLKDIALENAREGCVFETYSALEMHALAARAQSEEHRALFESIAKDETEHAELAWDLHAAFLERLEPAERSEVEAALSDALCALRAAPRPSFPLELHETLGLPQADLSHALRVRLVEQLSAA